MRITAVEEYGLRCLIQLARKGTKGQLSISEIAELEGLSVPYASKLLAILRRAKLVKAERGRSGGFSIAHEPKDITLYDVMTALGGPLIDPNHCAKFSGQLDQCIHHDHCSIHDALGGLAGYVQTFLSGTTLGDLLSGDTTRLHQRSDIHVVISRTALERELSQVPDTLVTEQLRSTGTGND